MSVGIVVLAIAVVAGASSISPLSLAAAVAGGAPEWLLLAAVLNVLSHTAYGMVWRDGLKAAGLGAIRLSSVMRAHWICRGASELLPFQLGEAARVVALRREPGVNGATWRIVGSMAAFKTVDAAVTFPLAAIVLMVAVEPSPLVVAGIVSGVALVALGALAAWAGGLVSARLRGRAQAICHELVAGAALLRQGSSLISPVAWQLASTALRVGSLAAILIAYGVPMAAAPLMFAMLVLAGLLPLAPGGAGVREAAVVPMLVAMYGVGLDSALAASLAVQAVTLILALSGAGIAMASRARIPAPATPAPRPSVA